MSSSWRVNKRKRDSSLKEETLIPVTVLSGFLGSGKTTTLNHILDNKNGKRFAVIVNDMSEINIDSRLIRRTDEKLVELTNGCICCTLREDLVEQLVEIAKSGQGIDGIVVESTGISEPIHVAETFSYADNLEVGKDMKSLVRLDTMVTIIDASSFLTSFLGRAPDQDGTCSTSDRTINDLLLDQIQFADVLVLNKVDLVQGGKKEVKNIRAVLSDLNPLAKLVESSYGKVSLKHLISTGLFTFEKAEQNAAWFKEVWGDSLPESEEYGISSVVFRRNRPFHPSRLHALLSGIGTSRGENGGNVDASVSIPPAHVESMKSLIRAKGFLWLANRHQYFTLLQIAGGNVRLTRGAKWWAEVPKKDWPKDEAFIKEVLSNWQEPFGDRCQTLVLIGLKMDKSAVCDAFSFCLLTDDEMLPGREAWELTYAIDPFSSTTLLA